MTVEAALADYTARDRERGEMGAPIEQAFAVLAEAHEVCTELLYGCPWREALDSGSDRVRLEALMGALNHLLGGVELDLADRFAHHERRARQAFAICSLLPEAAAYRDDLAFFEAVGVDVRRNRTSDEMGTDSDVEVETALRQVVSEAVSASGVVDISAASGPRATGP